MGVEQVVGDLDARLRAATGKLVVVDFFATWCGPCKMMEPHFHRLALAYPDVLFLQVNEASNRAEMTSRGVRGYPTFHFYVGERKVDELVGAQPDELEAKIKQHRPKPSFSGAGHSLGGGATDLRQARLARLGGAAQGQAPSGMVCDGGVCRPAGLISTAEDMAVDSEEAELQRALQASMMGGGTMLVASAAAAAFAPFAAAAASAPAAAAPAAAAPAAAAPAPSAPADDSAAASAHAAAAEAADAADAAAEAREAFIAPQVNEEMKGVLLSMGFPEHGAVRALYYTANRSVDEAVEWMASHDGDLDINEPLLVPPESAAQSQAPLTAGQLAEKKAQLQQRIEQRRAQRAAANKARELELEKQRREQGKEMAAVREQMQVSARTREAELRRKEKEDSRRERERLRLELVKDKYERAIKRAQELGQPAPPMPQELITGVATAKPAKKPPAEVARLAVENLKKYRLSDEGLTALNTCRIYIDNALSKDDPKFHSINQENAAYRRRVGTLVGGPELLKAAGFRSRLDEAGRPCLRLDEMDADRLRAVLRVIDAGIAEWR